MGHVSAFNLSPSMISLFLSSLFLVIVNVSSLPLDTHPPGFTSATFKHAESGDKLNFDFDMDRHLWFDFSEADVDESKGRRYLTLPNRKSAGTVCLNGSWLGYAKPNLVAKDIKNVTILTGTNNCIDVKKMGINSMQPVSPIRYKPDSIATFVDKYFGSLGNVLTPLERKFRKIRSEVLPKMNSFLISGSSPLTIVDTVGKVYCFTPKGKSKNAICLVPDVSLIGLSYKNPFTAVMKGCNKDKSKYTKSIDLSNCHEFGTSTALTTAQATKQQLEAGDLITDLIGGGGGGGGRTHCPDIPYYIDTSPPDYNILKKLLEIRLEHNFNMDSQLLWPRKPKLVWRTSVSDTVFAIVSAICPPNLLNPFFMMMVREFFVYHLDETWNSAIKLPLGERESPIVAIRLTECLNKAERYSTSMQTGMLQSFQSFRTEADKMRVLHRNLTLNKLYDPVIEMAWVSFNLAYGLCHHFNEAHSDFFDHFLRTVNNLYFGPLAKRWLKPKIPPSTFRYLLGGFGVEEQFESLQLCASSVLQLTRNFEPFGRATIM